MGIAKHDPCTHGDQPVNPEQSAFEHLFVDQYRAAGLGCQHNDNARQIRWEGRPRTVVDLWDGAVEVIANDQFLLCRHHDVVTVLIPVDSKPSESDTGHPVMVAWSCACDPELSAGDRRKPDKGSHLDEIRADLDLNAGEAISAFDCDGVGSDARYLSPHGIDHVAELLHVGLGCGIANHGRAVGH